MGSFCGAQIVRIPLGMEVSMWKIGHCRAQTHHQLDTRETHALPLLSHEFMWFQQISLSEKDM